ncbi:tRNA-guanine transglycosylase [Nocardia panacis]|uniref:tRNA-guanine transglycosylase n=1 Tax=Nocardia panacis TaxID=2340916 RepID=A0A3A4KBK7_9NOCA|nr:tRNA-guanine transglycosylase [Nocardia panacis]RJO70850.1 tRNA-guanine transglycosylase [Nocardia panacis]
MTSREFVTKRGSKHRLPIFLPVFQPHRQNNALLSKKITGPTIDGCIVNSYFLYKQRDIRKQLLESGDLHSYLGFEGLVTTDSGAFQGFTRSLYLDNRDIVRFQDRIGSDVFAPLDLVTPPGDSRNVAESKLAATEKRIRQALPLAERGILAGVQQGGRFMELRRRSVRTLRDLGVSYLALGSLVPFFNRNHDLRFVAEVATDARDVIGPDIPIHLYGSGDPCEIPFLVAAGVNVFDSASYGHFARDGWYMTPFGALRDPGPLVAGEFRCDCPSCVDNPTEFPTGDELTLHNLWTICATMDEINRRLDLGTLHDYLEEIMQVHDVWFPTSALRSSWQQAGEPSHY